MKHLYRQFATGMLTLLFLLTPTLYAQTISTIAGGGNGDGNTPTQASLNVPHGIVINPSGDLFISETGRIRIVANGTINTFAGNGSFGSVQDNVPALSASIHGPTGMVFDSAGNLYIADRSNSKIRKIDTSGIVTIVAGGGNASAPDYGDGGLATDARLSQPTDVWIDNVGNLYIADTQHHRIRMVDTAGIITTLAGTGTSGYSGDTGPATAATLNRPQGIYINATGEIFIADTDNNRVRKVDLSGTITTIAGTGSTFPVGDNGPALNAGLNRPRDLLQNAQGDLLILDGTRVRKVDATTNIITTLAGGGPGATTFDGGLATDARFFIPSAIAIDSNNNLFIVDQGNLRVRKVDATTNIITTAAGGSVLDGSPATQASLLRPKGIFADNTGNLYIATEGHHRIRKVDTSNIISTIAGKDDAGFSITQDGVLATETVISGGRDVVVDPAGNIYFADNNGRIRKIDTSGIIHTVAGGGSGTGDNVPPTSIWLNFPSGLCLDASGNVYFSELTSNIVRKIDVATNLLTTVAGNGTAGFGGDGGLATQASLNRPSDVFVDASNNIFITDQNNRRIRKVDASGIITTVVGDGTFSHINIGDGGLATQAKLNSPASVFVDNNGNLYFSDTSQRRVRFVDATTNVITTLAGGGPYGFRGDGGLATEASFGTPDEIFVNNNGDIFIADSNENIIRKVDAPPFALSLSATPTTMTAGGVGTTLRAEIHDPNGVLQSADNTTPITFTLTSGDGTLTDETVTATGGVAQTTLSMSAVGTAIVQATAPASKMSFTIVQATAPTLQLALSSDLAFITEDGSDAAVIEAQIQDLNGVLQTGDNTTQITFNIIDNQLSNASGTLSSTTVTATAGIATTTLTGTAAGILIVEASTPGAASPTQSITVRQVTNPGGGGIGPGQVDPGDIITIAGGWLGDGGQATDAGFDNPTRITSDGSVVYVADRNNNRVRAINLNTGIITTLAGGGTAGWPDFGHGGQATDAQLNQPHGLFIKDSYLYIADAGNRFIRKVDLTTGIITNVAGGGNYGTPEYLNYPVGIYVDANNNLYIAESSGHVVRKVDPLGTITTLAGTSQQSGDTGDGGLAVNALLNYPTAVTGDAAGNLYIAESNNQRVRKIDTSGIITTFAGGGTNMPWPALGDGGPASSAQMRPSDIFVEGNTLYIVDSWTSRIRTVDLTTEIITSVAGGGFGQEIGDGGQATDARFSNPQGVWVNALGELYIADTNHQRVRHVNLSGIITTLAGGNLGDGNVGTQATLRMNWISHPYVDGANSVYIADSQNQRVRRLDSQGIIQTVAGGGSAGWPDFGDGGHATNAQLSNPSSVFIDHSGNLYILESSGPRVRKVDPFGTITTVAGGNNNWGYGGDGGPATNAQFNNPVGFFKDTNGNLYIADTNNHRIRMVDSAGIITTLAGNGTAGFSGDGGPATSASLNQPSGISIDSNGNLYIADARNNRIRMIDSAGIITTVVGGGNTGYPTYGDGGLATDAQLNFPTDITLDWANNLFIADRSQARVRKVSASTGIITTAAGNGSWGYGGDGGPATDAQLNSPAGVAVDLSGNLYIADVGNQRIRQVNLSPPGVETPTGTNVSTAPIDPETGTAPADIVFSNVDVPGETSLTSTSSGPPAPEGFQIGDEPVFFDITTTAQFSGAVEICYNYSNDGIVNDAGLALFHYENGAWVDITTSLDTTNDILCGSVTSFSPFALFQSQNAPTGPTIAALTAVQKIEIEKNAVITTNVQSNGTFKLKKGDPDTPGLIDGSVLTVGNIQIEDHNHITGDITSGAQIELPNDPKSLTLEGILTENGDVTPINLPPVVLSEDPSGAPKIKVKKNTSLTLQPNTETTPVYGDLKIEKGATVTLHSGTYTFKSIDLKQEAHLHVEILDNTPVTINLSKSLDLDKETQVTVSNGDASHLLFQIAQPLSAPYNNEEDDDDDGGDDDDDDDGGDDDDDGNNKSGKKIKIDKEAHFVGTIYAPAHKIEVHKNTVITGALIGLEVKLKQGVQFTGALASHLNVSQPPATKPTPSEKESNTHLAFEMAPNFPNPFNPETTLRYALPEVADVRLSIYSILGQEIRVLINKAQGPGVYTVVWNGRDALGRQVASGIYFSRLQAGKHVAINKMLLTK